MGAPQEDMITKETIIDYVDKLEIKKTNLGGFDKVDVYYHMQELVKLYGKYTEQLLAGKQQTMEEQHKEIENLKVMDGMVRKELEDERAIVHEHAGELEKYKETDEEQKNEMEKLKKELEELKNEQLYSGRDYLWEIAELKEKVEEQGG